jgi:hypothetical protein
MTALDRDYANIKVAYVRRDIAECQLCGWEGRCWTMNTEIRLHHDKHIVVKMDGLVACPHCKSAIEKSLFGPAMGPFFGCLAGEAVRCGALWEKSCRESEEFRKDHEVKQREESIDLAVSFLELAMKVPADVAKPRVEAMNLLHKTSGLPMHDCKAVVAEAESRLARESNGVPHARQGA